MKIFEKLKKTFRRLKPEPKEALEPSPPTEQSDIQIAPLPNVGVTMEEATEAMKQFAYLAILAAEAFQGMAVVINVSRPERSNNWLKMHSKPMRRRTLAERRRRK